MTPSHTSPQSLQLGSAWYPEHWPEERWAEDVRLMQAAGMTVARIAEYAWSTIEPAAGEFNLDWLERAIELLERHGLQTFLGTPTGSPPAWLIARYPDILPVDEHDRRVQFGNRCHYCPNAPEMLHAAQRIAAALAQRFGSHPQVIGWQIDNELGRVCFCPRCQGLFQEFLQQRYGSLEKLNRAWATAYWSQAYSAWEQIPIPRMGRKYPEPYHNPGLLLEYQRFITLSNRRFQKAQVDQLRPHLHPGAWIAHNFMGWHVIFDHYELARDLDLAAYDWYVPTGRHNHLRSGAQHDLTRGFKRKNYWIMETQPGSVNWAATNTVLDQGEARAMAWHAIAHGAEAILYWQWRSALGGQEQYHGTLVDQSGQPRPFYREAQQLGRDFKRIGDRLAGSTIPARVAMLNCYESRWSLDWQRHHQDFDYVAYFNHCYRPLARRNVAMDIISADEKLDGYQLVIAPALNILDETRQENLENFVRRGGTLVLTIRSGMKDRTNALLPSRQPGPLRQLTGVEVEEYYALKEPVDVKGEWFTGCAQIWAERLNILDAGRVEIIARYGRSNGWLDDQIAATAQPYGSGMVYFLGAYLDTASQQAFMDHILRRVGIETIATPEGVEFSLRHTADGGLLGFLINHTNAEQAVALPWPAKELLSNQKSSGEIRLPPYAVRVLEKLLE